MPTRAGAKRRINVEAAEIKHLIARKRKDKTGFERWMGTLKNKFDTIVSNIRSRLKGKGKEANIDTVDQADASTSSSTGTSKITEKHEESPLRSFSCSLTPMLRSYLLPDIKQEFLDRIRAA